MACWTKYLSLFCVLSLALGACTEDNPGGSDNNGFDLTGGDATSNNGGADAGPDAMDLFDTRGGDVSQDTDSGDDGGDEEATPFTVEGLSSGPWYAVTPLTNDPAVTGVVFRLAFASDMSVSAGGFGEETSGKWEIFGDERVRLYELDNGANGPNQFVVDADVSDGIVSGLEMVIPDGGPNGNPLVLRFEQAGGADVAVADIAGNWQTEQKYDGENGGQYRLVLRFLADTVGYGIFHGAYVEYISGTARTITYDDGKTFWFLDPGDDFEVPALAGEIRMNQDGTYQLWSPRETPPDSDEFEAVRMNGVDTFSL